jgi:hypothetical protein
MELAYIRDEMNKSHIFKEVRTTELDVTLLGLSLGVGFHSRAMGTFASLSDGVNGR